MQGVLEQSLHKGLMLTTESASAKHGCGAGALFLLVWSKKSALLTWPFRAACMLDSTLLLPLCMCDVLSNLQPHCGA